MTNDGIIPNDFFEGRLSLLVYVNRHMDSVTLSNSCQYIMRLPCLSTSPLFFAPNIRTSMLP